MEKINIGRLFHLMKIDVQENKKSYLQVMGYFYVACLLVEIGFCFLDKSGSVTERGMAVFLIICLGILLLGMMSMFRKPVSTKAKSVTYLTLPATNMEKFLSRFLILTLGWFLVALLVVVFADVTRLLIQETFIVQKPSAISEFMKNVFGGYGSVFTGLYTLMFFKKFLWFHSLYLLGGCCFSTHAGIKTTAIIGIATALFSRLSFWLFTKYPLGQSIESYISDNNLIILSTIFFFVWTVLNYLLAYRYFVRIQIVEYKGYKKFHL